ncbi:MAG: hypothetical protein LBJ12_05990 [Oscillospiraceae bacterium]|jgi:hypothetical protein|nr:hypothetical protein [Oscillospiraceae bacterium]
MKKITKLVALLLAVLITLSGLTIAASAYQFQEDKFEVVVAANGRSFVMLGVLYNVDEDELNNIPDDEANAIKCVWTVTSEKGEVIKQENSSIFDSISSPLLSESNILTLYFGLKPGNYNASVDITFGSTTVTKVAQFTVLDWSAYDKLIVEIYGPGKSPWPSIRYTEESWERYMNAMEELDVLFAANAVTPPTQQDLDLAVQKLVDAYRGLEKKGGIGEAFWKILDFFCGVFSKLLNFGISLGIGTLLFGSVVVNAIGNLF